jgi:hypothetical protein
MDLLMSRDPTHGRASSILTRIGNNRVWGNWPKIPCARRNIENFAALRPWRLIDKGAIFRQKLAAEKTVKSGPTAGTEQPKNRTFQNESLLNRALTLSFFLDFDLSFAATPHAAHFFLPKQIWLA